MRTSISARYRSPSFASGAHTVEFKFVGPSGTYGTVDALQITGSSDTTAPSAIGDLAATASTTTNGAVNLSWTAPGNDGTVGTATSYLVRYSTSAINSEGAWSSATIVTTGIPTPAASGTAQSMSVTGLTSGTTYYFAVRAQDAVPNLGDLSNSPSAVASTVSSPGAGTYDDTDAGWTYGGTWVSYTATGPYNGTERYSTVLNSTATFSFTGTGFVFYYSTDKNRGSMQIRVDGNLIATLNEYNSAHLYQRTYRSPSFASGAHTVEFKFVGPSGTYGTVDALQITGSSDTTAPSAIGDLAATASTTTNGAVNLSWTAPGNDGTVGTATSYLVRYSTSAINSEGLVERDHCDDRDPDASGLGDGTEHERHGSDFGHDLLLCGACAGCSTEPGRSVQLAVCGGLDDHLAGSGQVRRYGCGVDVWGNLGDVFGDRTVQRDGTLQHGAQQHGHILVHGHRLCVLLLYRQESGQHADQGRWQPDRHPERVQQRTHLSEQLQQPELCFRRSHGGVQVCGSVRDLWDGGRHYGPALANCIHIKECFLSRYERTPTPGLC